MKNIINKVLTFFKKVFSKESYIKFKEYLPKGSLLFAYIIIIDMIIFLALITMFITNIL